jgi:small subunit ribosomal protein S1
MRENHEECEVCAQVEENNEANEIKETQTPSEESGEIAQAASEPAAKEVAETEVQIEATGEESQGEEGVKEEVEVESSMAEYDKSFTTLTSGTIVTGKVVEINPDEVMVDVGYKSEGRIPQHELGLKPGETPDSILKVGDNIDVFILKVEDAEGNVLLSKKRADARIIWERLFKLEESGEVIEAQVTEKVKGGLLVDVGVRGFVPASHVDRTFVENLDKYVGQTLRLKVIEIDRQKNNVVLSRKNVIEEEYSKNKEDIFKKLKEGAKIKGVVRRITDFGAFIDIGGGVEGLLHVSELAWNRVRHPKDVLSEGQEVEVMVLEVNPEKERISLSLKETLPDPWSTVDERYKIGDLVEVEISRLVDFGAFAKLEEGVEGLIHVSQLADHHVNAPSEVVKPKDKVKVKVVSLDKKARRIGLSIKDAQETVKKKQEPKEQTFADPEAEENIKLGDVCEGLQNFFERQNNQDEDKEKDEE